MLTRRSNYIAIFIRSQESLREGQSRHKEPRSNSTRRRKAPSFCGEGDFGLFSNNDLSQNIAIPQSRRGVSDRPMGNRFG